MWLTRKALKMAYHNTRWFYRVTPRSKQFYLLDYMGLPTFQYMSLLASLIFVLVLYLYCTVVFMIFDLDSLTLTYW